MSRPTRFRLSYYNVVRTRRVRDRHTECAAYIKPLGTGTRRVPTTQASLHAAMQ